MKNIALTQGRRRTSVGPINGKNDMRQSITYAGAAALALLILASCGKKEEPKTAAAPPPATSPAATPPASSAAAPSDPSPSAAVAAAAETPSSALAAASNAGAAGSAGGVLASAEGNAPGTRVDVLELKRTSGDSVMLKLAIVNDSDKPFDMRRFKGDGYDDYRSISGVYLLDGASKRQYFVLKGADQKCVCSQNIEDVAPKARVNVWARFTAPPADVQKIAIVVPHFIPVEDVPIAR